MNITLSALVRGSSNVRELVLFSALNNVVKNKDGAMVGRFEDKYVLVLGLFVVDNLVDFERHCLARP